MSTQELSQEEKKKLEDDAFAAAMSGDEVDAPKVPNEPEPTTQPDEPVTQEDEVKDERVEVIPGFTKEELEQLKTQAAKVTELQKALDTTNGTYGGKLRAMQQVIDDLKKPQPEKAEGAIKKQLTIDDLKNLKTNFPELAEDLVKDLGELLTQDKPDTSNHDEVKRLRDEFESARAKREEEEQVRAVKLLTKSHPDFREIATFNRDDTGMLHWKDMAFANWLSGQNQEVINTVLSSNDPDDLSDVISSYKESIAPKEEPTDKRKKSLENAVMAKGVTANRALSDKDRENAAFAAAMAE